MLIFAIEGRLVIDVKLSFPLNILRTKGQNLTECCTNVCTLILVLSML